MPHKPFGHLIACTVVALFARFQYPCGRNLDNYFPQVTTPLVALALGAAAMAAMVVRTALNKKTEAVSLIDGMRSDPTI